MDKKPANENLEEVMEDLDHQATAIRDELKEREPESLSGSEHWDAGGPDPDLPQDPGIPGGPPSPDPEREGSLERPIPTEDPQGIDAPGSDSEPPPNH